MFGIGGFEFFLILIFGFLIVGPDRLPAMAKTVGQAINKFRGAQEEMNKVIKTEVYDPDSKEPFKDPLEALEKMGQSKSSDAKPADKAPAASSTASGDRRESFSERKARYEKERAAKKAADAEKEAAEKRAANAAKDAPKSDAKPQAKEAAPEKASAQPAATEEKGE